MFFSGKLTRNTNGLSCLNRRFLWRRESQISTDWYEQKRGWLPFSLVHTAQVYEFRPMSNSIHKNCIDFLNRKDIKSSEN